jgi:hypothetical protein
MGNSCRITKPCTVSRRSNTGALNSCNAAYSSKCLVKLSEKWFEQRFSGELGRGI